MRYSPYLFVCLGVAIILICLFRQRTVVENLINPEDIGKNSQELAIHKIMKSGFHRTKYNIQANQPSGIDDWIKYPLNWMVYHKSYIGEFCIIKQINLPRLPFFHLEPSNDKDGIVFIHSNKIAVFNESDGKSINRLSVRNRNDIDNIPKWRYVFQLVKVEGYDATYNVRVDKPDGTGSFGLGYKYENPIVDIILGQGPERFHIQISSTHPDAAALRALIGRQASQETQPVVQPVVQHDDRSAGRRRQHQPVQQDPDCNVETAPPKGTISSHVNVQKAKNQQLFCSNDQRSMTGEITPAGVKTTHLSRGSSCVPQPGESTYKYDFEWTVQPCDLTATSRNDWSGCNEYRHGLHYLPSEFKCYTNKPKYHEVHSFSLRNPSKKPIDGDGNPLMPRDFGQVNVYSQNDPTPSINLLGWGDEFRIEHECQATDLCERGARSCARPLRRGTGPECPKACQKITASGTSDPAFQKLWGLDERGSEIAAAYSNRAFCHVFRTITLHPNFHQCLNFGWAIGRPASLKSEIFQGAQVNPNGLVDANGVPVMSDLPQDQGSDFAWNDRDTGYAKLCTYALETTEDRAKRIERVLGEILRERGNLRNANAIIPSRRLIYRKDAARPTVGQPVVLIDALISQGTGESDDCNPRIDFSGSKEEMNAVCTAINNDPTGYGNISEKVQEQCLALRNAQSSAVTSPVGLGAFNPI